jgi:DNA polymerase-3 subunit delta'
MRPQIESYATNSTPHSITNKLSAVMQARTTLQQNIAPLLTCEALMCIMAKA